MNFFNMGGFGNSLGNFGHQLDGEMQHLMNDLNKEMGSFFPFFGSMMGFNNFNHHPTKWTNY